MQDSFEVEPVSVVQVQAMDKDRLVAIDDDVAGVVRDLRGIDPGLRVRFDAIQEFFVVYHVTDGPNGRVEEQLVLTTRELDQRVVNRVRFIDKHNGRYDFVGDLESQEERAKVTFDKAQAEKLGDPLERLAFAIRKDLGVKTSAVVGG